MGRDPSEIEITAMFRNLPPSPTVDDIVRGAEAFAEIGVSTLVTSPIGHDPASALESTFGPAIERLAEIEPKRL